jgi:cell pole-organizing protein PopZ
MGHMMAQDGEASVEEILESIKKVIARDNRAGALETRRRRESVSDHVIAPQADPARPHVVRDENDGDYDGEGSDGDEVLDLANMECAAEPASPVQDDSEDAPLIAEIVRDAMHENLAALAMLAEPGARPQIVRSGETSLEGLTRELLRPMLAQWLEANLPGMVEKLVQAEIARIVGKRP